MINLIATYINPDPDANEEGHIDLWKVLCRECVHDSTFPTIIIGDANKQGKTFINGLTSTSQI